MFVKVKLPLKCLVCCQKGIQSVNTHIVAACSFCLCVIMV